MNDRRRILDLVQQGKLTPEQAELLLEALGKRKQEQKTKTSGRPWDVRSMNDLKQLGSQLSNTVGQSLADVRKVVENELKTLSNLGFNSSLTASTQVELPTTVNDIWLETKNGQVQVYRWDHDYVRLVIRGQIRATELATAEEQLEGALQATQTEHRYHLTIRHDAKAGVIGASVEIYVPAELAAVSLKTVNGEIRIDSVAANQLRAETTNGSIWIHDCEAVAMNLTTDNGGIDIHQGIQSTTENIYANTRNGTIVLEGLTPELRLTGVLKTAIGGIHVTHQNLAVDYVDPAQKMHARLTSEAGVHETNPTHVHCETKNGSIYVRE